MNEPGGSGHDCDTWFNTSKRLMKGVVTPSRAQQHNSRLLNVCCCPCKVFFLCFCHCRCWYFPSFFAHAVYFRAQNWGAVISRNAGLSFSRTYWSLSISFSILLCETSPHLMLRDKTVSFWWLFRSSASFSHSSQRSQDGDPRLFHCGKSQLDLCVRLKPFRSFHGSEMVFGGSVHTCQSVWLLNCKLSIINNYIMQFTQDIRAIMRVERTLKAGPPWIMEQAISFPPV